MNVLTLNSKVPRMEPQQVFVYGTLKKGFGNHERHLKHAKLLGEAQIEGIMFHLGGFPAINLGEKYTRIIGEVYQCSWEDILSMDQLEGVDSGFYHRIEVSIFPYRKAWTYVFTHEQASRQKFIIPSGIWRGPDDSPKIPWAGWGKGALVGAFQTDREKSTILLGTSDKAPFRLQRNEIKNKYDLVNRVTGEILGSYENLGDLLAKGTSRPILGLPAPSPNRGISETVKRQVYRQASGTPDYNPPARQTILDHPPATYTADPPKTPIQPQSERLLGVTAREA